jgi:hypothetical protein
MNEQVKDTTIDQDIQQAHIDRILAAPNGVLIEANELYIFARNDSKLYTERELPIIKNLDRKVARGTFDYEKSVTLWGYLFAEVNRKYKLNVGPAGRDIAARRFAIDYIQRESGDLPA